MTLVGTLRGLLRRWYVVVPGLVLAVAAAVGCYLTVAPQYERTATQLLSRPAASSRIFGQVRMSTICHCLTR